MKELTLQCENQYIYQRDISMPYENKINLSIFNSGDEDVDLKDTGCSVVTYIYDETTLPVHLIDSKMKDNVIMSCIQEGVEIDKKILDATITWKLTIEKPTILKKGESLPLVLSGVYTPTMNSTGIGLIQLISAHNRSNCIVYEVKQDMIICEFKSSKTNINYGEKIELSWHSNAGECILLPYDYEVEPSGKMEFQVYETTIFTLRAKRDNVDVERTIKVEVLDCKPEVSLKAELLLDSKKIKFETSINHTSYGYIDGCVGRIEKEVTVLNKNKREYTLNTVPKPIKTASIIVGGELPGISSLDYDVRKEKGVYVYNVQWEIINCDGEVNISKYIGTTSTILSNEHEGFLSFKSESNNMIPIKIEAIQDSFSFAEIYPLNTMEQSQ